LGFRGVPRCFTSQIPTLGASGEMGPGHGMTAGAAERDSRMLRKLLIAAGVVLAASASAVDTARAVKLGQTCGGIAGLRCDAGLFCEMAAGLCRTADAAGACVKAPEICAQIYQPVCGCD